MQLTSPDVLPRPVSMSIREFENLSTDDGITLSSRVASSFDLAPFGTPVRPTSVHVQLDSYAQGTHDVVVDATVRVPVTAAERTAAGGLLQALEGSGLLSQGAPMLERPMRAGEHLVEWAFADGTSRVWIGDEIPAGITKAYDDYATVVHLDDIIERAVGD